MNWLDIVIIVIILIGCLLGIKSGFILQVANILALVLGIVAAGQFHHNLAIILKRLIKSENAANFTAYIIIFLAVVIGLRIIAYFLRAILSKIKLQSIDRILGGCLGALKGILICGALLWGIVHYQHSQLNAAAQESRLSLIILRCMDTLEAVLPSECRTKIRAFFHDVNKRIRSLPDVVSSSFTKKGCGRMLADLSSRASQRSGSD